jgi:uncharacterized protein (DUF305 family)
MRIALIVVTLAVGIPTIWMASPSPPESAADAALNQSMKRMDSAMKRIGCSGNPDADFARMMVPHHQGAIEMAAVELQFGKDLRLRRLAQEILVTQQSEIEVMTGALNGYDRTVLNPKPNNWCTQ